MIYRSWVINNRRYGPWFWIEVDFYHELKSNEIAYCIDKNKMYCFQVPMLKSTLSKTKQNPDIE